jgi:hypothetical protein
MSNMENLEAQLAERDRQQRVYDAAMTSLKHQRLDQDGAGLALMFAWDSFGEEVRENRAFAMMSKLSGMFCIGFAFVTPCLLFMRVVL